MIRVEYSSNNSGGRWWLKDADWKALEDAGWEVEWGGLYFCGSKFSFNQPPEGKPTCAVPDKCQGHRRYESYAEVLEHGEEGKWLNALAKCASKEFLSLQMAIAEFEKVTGQCASDPGCNCCGEPHYFSGTAEDGSYVASGL